MIDPLAHGIALRRDKSTGRALFLPLSGQAIGLWPSNPSFSYRKAVSLFGQHINTTGLFRRRNLSLMLYAASYIKASMLQPR